MKRILIPALALAGLLFATTAEARPKPLRWLFGKGKAVAKGVTNKVSKIPQVVSRSGCAGGRCSK